MVGVDLPPDICLAAPGRALNSVRSGDSLIDPPVRKPRRLRVGGVRAGGSAAGGRFFSRSDIDLVGRDPTLSQTWLAATAGGGFSASAFDISAESKRAVHPPKFNPHEALQQLRSRSRVPYTSPHAALVQTRALAAGQSRRTKQQQNTQRIRPVSRPYALQAVPERPRWANVSPQRRPTSAVHRPTSAAPKPVVKGRVPWMSLIGVEGDRPAMYETRPARANGPNLQSAPHHRKSKKRGDPGRCRGRPSTAAQGAQRGLLLEQSTDSVGPESSPVARPSTAPSGGRSSDAAPSRSLTSSRSPSPTGLNRTHNEGEMSYSRALAASSDGEGGCT